MSRSKRILIVDDEVEAVKALFGILKSFGYDADFAQSGKQALNRLGMHTDLVLLDIRMPDMDGYEVAKRIRENPETADLPIIMVTALSGKFDRLKAVQAGANDFVQKPIDVVELRVRVDALLKYKNSQDEIKRQRAELEEANEKLKRAYKSEEELLENTFQGVINVLVDLLSLQNPLAFNQATRLKTYIQQLCEKLNIRDAWQYELAAILSQIGCVTIPSEVLELFYRGETLTPEEEAMLASHPAVGQELLQNIPRLELVASIVGMQSEAFSKHVFTTELQSRPPHLLGTQLLKTVYDYDNLVNRGMTHRDAITELRKSVKRIYDPLILLALASMEVDESKDEAKLQLRIINFARLTPGMILGQDLHSRRGTLLARKGQEVNTALLKRLKNFLRRNDLNTEIRVMVPSEKLVANG